MTWRPTPASAAFGRVCSGGTSTTRSPRACARHASRHPARSSSGVNARGSSSPTGTSPLAIRTLHLRQVPWPPQVESIAIPFQLAASNTGVPLGTRTSVSSGRNRRRARLAPSSGAGSSRSTDLSGLTLVPGRRSPSRLAFMSTARVIRLRRRPPPVPGAPRSSSRPTRRGRAADRPRGRMRRTPPRST